MNKLRKFLVVSVMVMSVITMSGVSVTPVSAAASAGDLIKMEGLSSVYYLGEDGKRYVFPNESTYFSWYADFSSVVTISATELQSYPLGGNVTMRPGTTLVKITTDPSVYAVEPNGVLRKIQNEAQAAALYGTNWNRRVVDLADAFFTNYTVGAPLADGEIPVGSLVKNANNPAVFYYDGTNYRAIASETAMSANRLWMKYVLTVTNTLVAGGTPLTGMEAGLVRVNQGSTTGSISSGSGVMVSLNAGTPTSKSVPGTVSRVPFTRVNFTASNDGNVVLESVTVKRSGLSDHAKFERVWVEHNGSAVTSRRALNSNNEAVLTFAPAINIGAGQTVSLDIIASLNGITGNAALEIASASAITAGGATVTGSFPVRGNLMSFADYNVAKLNLTGSTSTITTKVGDTDVEIGSFNINFVDPQRDVVVNSLTLRNAGAEIMSAIVSGLRIENNGEVVTSGVKYDGRNVTFTFKNGGLNMLKDDGNQTFYIKGDIIGKDNIAPNSLVLSLQKPEDLNAYEKATGFGVSYGFTSAVQLSTVTVTSGAVSVARRATSPANTDVIKGARNVVVLLANVKADEAINAEGMRLSYANTNPGGGIAESSFHNVRVHLNNVLLGSFDPATTTNIHTFIPALIDSAFTLRKGDNEVRVTVDVKTNADPVAAFKADLRANVPGGLLDLPEYASNGNTVSSGEISGTAAGATITVEGGLVEVSRNDGFANDRRIIKGTSDVVLGRFAVKALNDAVRINSIELSNNNGVGTTTSGTAISDMKLFVDGVQIGTTRDFSTGATFSSVNYTIARNATKIIELRGAFDSSAANDSVFRTNVTFNVQDSLGKAITPSMSAQTVQHVIKEAGTLTASVSPNTPRADIIVAAWGVEREVAQFRLTSQDDSTTITELEIENVNRNDAASRVSAYRLYLGTTLLDSSVATRATSSVATGTTTDKARFTISGEGLKVPANESVTISVRAVMNTIDAPADSGRVIQIAISDMKAISSNGTELDMATRLRDGSNYRVSGREMVIRRTRPTLALVSGIVGGSASAQELMRFSISADANQDLRVTELRFAKDGTAPHASSSTFILHEVGGAEVATATTTVTSAAEFAGMNIEIGKGQSKVFRLVANTSAIAKDFQFGVTLTNATSSIVWNEHYIDGYRNNIDATHIMQLPISGGVTRY